MDEKSNDVNTDTDASAVSEATAQESQTEQQAQTEITGKENLQDVVSDVLKKHFPNGEEDKAHEESPVKELNQTKKDSEKKVEKKSESSEQVETGKDGEKEKEKKDEGKVEDKKPLTDEEVAKLPKRAQERIRELVNEKKEIETQFKEPATRMWNIEQFCQKNGINGTDFDNTFKLLALVRTNPQEGIKALEAEIAALKIATGQALPVDLQKKVDEGLVDPETAKEMARLRLEAQGRKTDAEKFQKQSQASTQQQLATATQQWEQSKMGIDPDFKPAAQNAPPGKYEMTFLMFKDKFFNGPPLYKIADAITLLEKCYAEVNSSIAQYTPRPRRQAPVRSSNSSSREEKQEPKIDITKPGWAKSVADGVLAKRGIER